MCLSERAQLDGQGDYRLYLAAHTSIKEQYLHAIERE
jgi:hypothetical protein